MDFAKHVAEMTRNTAWLALASLGVVFALGLVEALSVGWSVHCIVLMTGAILSVVAVWVYNITAVMFAAGSRRRQYYVLTTLGVLLPYLLGFYVLGYRGFWGLIEISRNFEAGPAGVAVGSVLLGFFLLSQLRRLVEVRQWVDELVTSAVPAQLAGEVQRKSRRKRKRR